MLSAFTSTPEETEVKSERKRISFLNRNKNKEAKDKEAKADSRDAVEDETEVKENKEKRAGLFKGGKNQKAVVYNQFSDDPKVVLEVVTEDGMPKITNGDDVIVKVQVCCKLLKMLAPFSQQFHSAHLFLAGVHCLVQ